MKPQVQANWKQFTDHYHLRTIERWIVTFLLIGSLMGCKTYYLVSPQTEIDQAIMQMYANNDYVILHTKDTAIHISHIRLDEANKAISGIPASVALNHMYFQTQPKDRRNSYRYRKGDPTVEAHVYAPRFTWTKDIPFKLAYEDIDRILFYNLDKQATDSSQLLGFILVPASIMGVLIVIGLIWPPTI